MANLSNINNKFLVTTGGNVLIGQTSAIGSSIFQVTGNSTFAGNVTVGNSGNINIPTAASGNANLHFDGTDFKITSNSSSANLKLETSSTTRLTINSTGDAIFAANVGINTGGATPDRVLDVRGNGLSIFGSGSNTELMLRGQVEGTGTIRSLGAWHWSVRSDVGGDNDDLKLLRFNTGTFAGTAMQIRSDNGGVAIGLNNEGYASQILSVKSGAADNVFYGESSDANCFASFRDSNSTANIEFGAIGNSHVFRKDTSIKMVIDGDGDVGIGTDLPNAKLDIGIGTLANNGYGGLRIFDDANHFWMLILKNSVGASRLSLYNGQGSIPLVFQEGGGNVGIGTTSPTEKLSVSGNIELDDMPANGTRYLMTNETNTGTGRINIQAGGGSAAYGGGLSLLANSHASKPGWVIAGISSGAGSGATEGRFVVNTHGLGTGTDIFTVLRTGNVGIGTDTPLNKLFVSASTAGDYAGFIENTNSTNGYGLVARTAHTGASAYAFAARAASTDILVVRADGNVGIGTGSPDYKLEVKDGQDSSLFSGLVVERSANTTAVCLNAVGGALNLNTNSSMPIKFRIGNTSMQTINTNGGRAYAGFAGWRMFEYGYTVSVGNGATVDLFQNTSAHSDLHMVQIAIRMYHSGRTYFVGSGTVGGYGMNIIGSGSGITNGGLTSAVVSSGIRKLQISQSSGYTAQATIYIQFRLDDGSGINVLNGTLSSL